MSKSLLLLKYNTQKASYAVTWVKQPSLHFHLPYNFLSLLLLVVATIVFAAMSLNPTHGRAKMIEGNCLPELAFKQSSWHSTVTSLLHSHLSCSTWCTRMRMQTNQLFVQQLSLYKTALIVSVGKKVKCPLPNTTFWIPPWLRPPLPFSNSH